MGKKTSASLVALASAVMLTGCGGSSSSSASFTKAWSSDTEAKKACDALTDKGSIVEKWASTPISGKATLQVDRNTQDQDGAVLICRYVQTGKDGTHHRFTLRVYGPGKSSYQSDLEEQTSDANYGGDPVPVTAVNSKEGTALMVFSPPVLKVGQIQDDLTKMVAKLHA